MNDAPKKTIDPSTNPAPARVLLPGSTGNAENPYPWFRPMPVVWVCVIICIVLIVVGSLMNRAQAEARKRPAIESFSKVLDDFDFTDAQRATLLGEYEKSLDSGGLDESRRKLVAEKLVHHTKRWMGCVVMMPMKGLYEIAFEKNMVSMSLRSECLRQCDRLIYGVDHGLIALDAGEKQMASRIGKWKELNDAVMTQFISECDELADSTKVPENVPEFKFYESLLRGLIEARAK